MWAICITSVYPPHRLTVISQAFLISSPPVGAHRVAWTAFLATKCCGVAITGIPNLHLVVGVVLIWTGVCLVLFLPWPMLVCFPFPLPLFVFIKSVLLLWTLLSRAGKCRSPLSIPRQRPSCKYYRPIFSEIEVDAVLHRIFKLPN